MARTTVLKLVCLFFLSLSVPLRAEAAQVPSDVSGAQAATAGEADTGPWWRRFSGRMAQVWNSSVYDLYVPVYTWHNRLLYDSQKAAAYNETPWGLGFGKSVLDEDGDWHALYAMGFQDSNEYFQPIVGYAFQKNWKPSKDSDWRIGGGFTVGITGRHEYDYIPLPLPLPLVGVEYKRFAVQAVYIPGGYNDGNVLFCWLRWRLN